MRGEVRDCNLSFRVRDTELHLATASELAEIRSEFSSCEPIFHRPEFGTSRSITRSSTIWQRTREGWKIVYRQGTIVQPVQSA